MIALPLPRTRQGWLASIILIFITFLIFYVALYPSLIEYYENDFTNAKNSPDCLKCIQGVDVFVRAPQYFFIGNRGTMSVLISNRTGNTLKDANLFVNLDPSPFLTFYDFEPMETTDVQTIFPLGNIPDEATIESRIELLPPQPGTKTAVKIKIGIEDNGTIKKYDIILDKNIYLVANYYRAIIGVLIRNTLIPPWANGLLPIVVLYWVWLVERRACIWNEPDWQHHKIEENEILREISFWSPRGFITIIQVLIGGAGGIILSLGFLWALIEVAQYDNNDQYGLFHSIVILLRISIYVVFALGLTCTAIGLNQYPKKSKKFNILVCGIIMVTSIVIHHAAFNSSRFKDVTYLGWSSLILMTAGATLLFFFIRMSGCLRSPSLSALNRDPEPAQDINGVGASLPNQNESAAANITSPHPSDTSPSSFQGDDPLSEKSIPETLATPSYPSQIPISEQSHTVQTCPKCNAPIMLDGRCSNSQCAGNKKRRITNRNQVQLSDSIANNIDSSQA